MDMYSRDNKKIGTKTITQGGGLQRADGSFGDHVKMNFAPPPQAVNTPQATQTPKYNFNNGQNGIYGAPQVTLQAPQDNPNMSRIISNLAALKNANMQKDYDKLNATIYDSAQTRQQRQNQFISELAQKQQDMNLRAQQFDLTHDLNVQNAQYARQAKGNDTDAMLKRGKLFDETYAGNYDQDTVGYLRDNQAHYDKLKADYIANGTFTPAQYDDGGWFGGARLNMGNQNQAGQQQTQAARVDPNYKSDPAYKEFLREEAIRKNKEIMGRDENIGSPSKWWDDPKYKNNPNSL